MSISPYWHVASNSNSTLTGEIPLASAGSTALLNMSCTSSNGITLGTSWQWYTRNFSNLLVAVGGQTISSYSPTINVSNSNLNYTVKYNSPETVDLMAGTWVNSGGAQTGSHPTFHANPGSTTAYQIGSGWSTSHGTLPPGTQATIHVVGTISVIGGENLNNTHGTPSDLTLEYSANGGTTWNTIQSWHADNAIIPGGFSGAATPSVTFDIGATPAGASNAAFNTNFKIRISGLAGVGTSPYPWGSSEISIGGMGISWQYPDSQLDFITNAYYLYETAPLSWTAAPTGVGQSVTIDSHFVGQNPVDFNAGVQNNTLQYSWRWSDNMNPVAGQTGPSYTFTLTPAMIGLTLTCYPRHASDAAYPAVSGLTYFPNPIASAMGSLTGTKVISITDATGPTISITSPTTGYSIPDGATQFPVVFSTSDNIWITNVKLYVDGVLKTTVPSTYPTPLTGGTINVSSFDLSAGSHTVTMVATDENNNTSTTSISVYKPSVALTATLSGTNASDIQGGSGYTIYSGTVTFRAAASSFSGVGFIRYNIDGGMYDTIGPLSGTIQTFPFNTAALNNDTTHTYYAETYTSGATLLSTSNTITFKVDNLSPVVTITSPATSSSFPGVGTIPVAITTSDPHSGVASVFMYVDGAQVANATKIADNSYTANISASSLSVGSHTINARAVDRVGNLNSTGSTISITISAGTKTVNSITISPSSYAIKGTVNITAATTGAITGDYLRWSIDASLFFSEIAYTGQVWNSSLNTLNPLLADGPHTLWAKLYNANNSLSASLGLPIIVDNSNPTAAISTNVNGSTVLITGTSSDAASGLSQLDYLIDGVVIAGLKDTLGPSLSTPGQSYTINKTTSALSNGSHTIAVEATDNAGNYFITAPLTVTTPQITSSIVGTTQQGSGGIIFGAYHKGNIAFVGTASIVTSVFTGTPTVKVFIDASLTGLTTTPDGTVRIFTTANFDTTTLANGIHTATYKLYETVAGSPVERATQTINFTVDNSGPIVTSSYNGTSGLITLSASATDAYSGVNKVEFYVNGAKVGQSTSAPFNYAWDSSLLGAGSYQFYVIATDNVGNITSTITSAQTLVVSPPSPVTVIITSPSTATTVSGTTLSITATISGSQTGSVASVKFYIITNAGVETLLASVASSPYSTILNTTTQTDGNYFLIARAFNVTPIQLGADSNIVYIQIKNGVTDSVTAIGPAGVIGTQTFAATITGAAQQDVQWFARTINPYTPTITQLGIPDTTDPYSTIQDTTILPNATYYLYAVKRTTGNVVTAISKFVSFNISNSSILGTYIPTLNHTSSSGPTDYRVVFPVKAYDAGNNEIYAFNETTGVLRNGAEVNRLIYYLDPQPIPNTYCFYEVPPILINGVDPNPGIYTPWKYFKGLVLAP